MQVTQLVAATVYGLMDTNSQASAAHYSMLASLAAQVTGAIATTNVCMPAAAVAAQQRSIAVQNPALKLSPQHQNHLIKYMFGLLKTPPTHILQSGQQQAGADASPLARIFHTAAPTHAARVQQVEAGG